MSKPVFVVSCPIDTYSGYGSRSRDVVKAIINTDKYDVKILPQRWGETPWGYIADHEEWSFLSKHILPEPKLSSKPEIWMQITIPSEFQPVGKYNIGVTAGIESNLCNPTWIEGLNRMNLNLVSSQHSKTVFEQTKAEKKDDRTGQVVQTWKLEKPIEVLFEGADLETYFQTAQFDNEDLYNDILKGVKEDFAFLFVGHWLSGNFGHDRKNVSLLVKSFLEVFKNKMNPPALILKTAHAVPSKMDREELIKRINELKKSVKATRLPNIYVLQGNLHDLDINELYNHPKVKAMVSLTKGEGFGRPLLEFTLSGKPLITTNWSGHVDFLHPEGTSLINGELEKVDPSAANDWLMKESSWFTPNHGEIGHYLKDVHKNYKTYKAKARKQLHHSKTNFSFEKMQELLESILDKNIPEFPKEVKLQLPKLKKVGETQANTELPKLKLPKLKKVNG